MRIQHTVFVRNWNEFRSSIARLVKFSKARRISAVLGAHIEMSSSGELFEAGSTFQPNEAKLAFTSQDLSRLDQVLRDAGNEPKEIVTAKFVVVPIGAFWRMLGDVVGWFRGGFSSRDDILPPLPEELWRENLAAVAPPSPRAAGARTSS